MKLPTKIVKNSLWGTQIAASLFIALVFWPQLYRTFDLAEIGELAVFFQSGSLLAPILGGAIGSVLLHKNHEFRNQGIFKDLATSFSFTLSVVALIVNLFTALTFSNAPLWMSIVVYSILQAASITILIMNRVLDRAFQFGLMVIVTQAFIPFFVFVMIDIQISIRNSMNLMNIFFGAVMILSSRSCKYEVLRKSLPFLFKTSLLHLPNHLLGLLLLLGGKFYLGLNHGLAEVGWYQIPSLYGGGFMIASILLIPLTQGHITRNEINLIDEIYSFEKKIRVSIYITLCLMPLITGGLIIYFTPSSSRIFELLIAGIILAITAPLVWLNEYLTSVYLKSNENALRLTFVSLPPVLLVAICSLLSLGSPMINISLATFLAYFLRALLQVSFNLPKSCDRGGIVKFTLSLALIGSVSGVMSLSVLNFFVSA